ncbi:MAG TPA: BTAD domain-containing putative transcriptional regulator, partial [Caldilineaceae bacterium]|nr:BTAD domain-containing putative transcriptional regulator [Caldilineaceae bacterium]
MDERLRLTLLGHFAAFRRGAPLTGFESNKVRGLLAFLAVEQARGHSRASLIGLLWPDWPESSARRNLSQALFNLRQTLDDQNAQTPFLLVSRQEIRWNRAAPADIDGQQVLALLPEPGQIPDPAKMEQVSSLYRGRLLERFSLDDSDIFDHWLLTKREWLHGRVMAALHHYAQGLLSGGVAHFDTAHAIISQQLLLEPWQEEAHSQMMRLLAARGQRSAALAQFELCRAALAAELGVEPSQETLA